MATYPQRAKAIIGGMLNKPVADVTDAEVLRAAQSLVPRRYQAAFDVLTDAQKVQYYVGKIYQVQLSAIKASEGAVAGSAAKAAALAVVETEFAPVP